MSSHIPEFDHETIKLLLEQNYNLGGHLKSLDSYSDQNFLLTTNTDKLIVKFANKSDSYSVIEMQNQAMSHLMSHGLPVPVAEPNTDNETITKVKNESGETFFMRVLTYLPGHFYSETDPQTHTKELWKSLGRLMANIAKSMNNFDHPGAYRDLDWDLKNGLNVCQANKSYLMPEQLAVVDHFLLQYKINAYPHLNRLRSSVIHNDANDYNLIIDNIERPNKVTGLIDFGDMVHSHLVNELAVAAAYAMMNQADPLCTLETIVEAFHLEFSLTEDEFDILVYLITLRLCTTVCNAAKEIESQPDNSYLLVSVKPAWELLAKFKEYNLFSLTCRIKQACGIDPDPGQSKSKLIAFRKKHLGKTLSLSFKEPLKIVRGQGTYLYDETGTRYLDMVNNVCHVGHCHPKVVAAGQAQMAKLNTNTRFLHDNLINYTEKLLATMPDKLSVCMFVNSGSEANELAFRLAKAYTGSSEVLTVEGAYHGNTNACINVSPYKFDGPGGEGAPDHVTKVMLPDPYRGKFKGYDQSTGVLYANDVTRAINELKNKGKYPGLFICESLQGVAGQIIMPDGYLKQVYSAVREAGGVCIADEVQVGFGRVGTHMWAFETQGVIPDIVTLGKPIGNGHPMAAVITTQEIAEAFVTGMEYFNTFGGNPVSCAIGEAVLDVINEEDLMQNALCTGQYLMDQLRNLQNEFDVLGDVRGLGLFIGAELVVDRETKEPATELTSKLTEALKTQHIILSTEGPFHNVLKIKPPIVFNKKDADYFISKLQSCLSAIT